MKLLNRIAMLAVVLSLAFISSLAQDKASPQKTEPKPRQVWIRLKSGQILTGDLVHMDPVSLELTANRILASVPCDDLIEVMFAPPTPTTTPTSDESIEPVTESLHPTLIYRENAKYTDKARKNGVEGTVVLQVVFNMYGLLTDINVISGLPDGLTENAIEAAKKTRFAPAMKDGRPISVRGILEFPFNLYGPPPIKLLSPDDGAVFSDDQRKVTLQWEHYRVAKLYKVRIEQSDPNSSDWSFLQELEVAEPEHVFYFTGAQSLRWRVTAILITGKEFTSSWRTFRFTQ